MLKCSHRLMANVALPTASASCRLLFLLLSHIWNPILSWQINGRHKQIFLACNCLKPAMLPRRTEPVYIEIQMMRMRTQIA